MVFELAYKGHAIEFWQDHNNYVGYVIWFGEDVVKSGSFQEPSLRIIEVHTRLKAIIDAL